MNRCVDCNCVLTVCLKTDDGYVCVADYMKRNRLVATTVGK
jgi:hypothetical protein